MKFSKMRLPPHDHKMQLGQQELMIQQTEADHDCDTAVHSGPVE
jgi:hypothetical protein